MDGGQGCIHSFSRPFIHPLPLDRRLRERVQCGRADSLTGESEVSLTRRFFARHANALSFWAVLVVVALALAFFAAALSGSPP